MIRFLIFLMALTLLVALLLYAGHAYGNWPLPSQSPAILTYLACTTIVAFYMLHSTAQSTLFSQAYLLSIVLKMITGSVFIFIVIFIDRAGAKGNALLFIISYMLYTALEVGFLYRKINGPKLKP